MGLNSKYLTVSSKSARCSSWLTRLEIQKLCFCYFIWCQNDYKKSFHDEEFMLLLSDISELHKVKIDHTQKAKMRVLYIVVERQ